MKKILVNSQLDDVSTYTGEIIYTYDTGDVLVKILSPVELAKKFPVILESPNNIKELS